MTQGSNRDEAPENTYRLDEADMIPALAARNDGDVVNTRMPHVEVLISDCLRLRTAESAYAAACLKVLEGMMTRFRDMSVEEFAAYAHLRDALKLFDAARMDMEGEPPEWSDLRVAVKAAVDASGQFDMSSALESGEIRLRAMDDRAMEREQDFSALSMLR